MRTRPTLRQDVQADPELAAVVVVGGKGGLSAHYREVVEERGYELRHFEAKIPPGGRRTAGKIALVVVMVGMVSHSLRAQIERIVPDETKVVYVRTASVSGLRAAVDGLERRAA